MNRINNFSNYILDKELNSIIKNYLLESKLNEGKNPDIEWDLVNDFQRDYRTNTVEFGINKKEKKDWKSKLKSIVYKIKTEAEALDFFKNLISKVKNIPEMFRYRIIKYAIILLVGIVSINALTGSVKDGDIEAEIKKISAELNIKVEEVPDTKNIKTSNIVRPIPKFDPMTLSPSNKCLRFIKGEEKLLLKAYSLGDGKITVGWGHAEDVSKSRYNVGDTISIGEANKLFKKDIKHIKKSLKNLFRKWDKQGVDIKMTQGQYDALFSMTYNIGTKRIRKTKFIYLIKSGKFEEAAKRMLSTYVGKGDFKKGLSKRRKKEQKLFLNKKL